MKLTVSNSPRRGRDIMLTAHQIYKFMREYMTEQEIRSYKQISIPYKSDCHSGIYAEFIDNDGYIHTFMVGDTKSTKRKKSIAEVK